LPSTGKEYLNSRGICFSTPPRFASEKGGTIQYIQSYDDWPGPFPLALALTLATFGFTNSSDFTGSVEASPGISAKYAHTHRIHGPGKFA